MLGQYLSVSGGGEDEDRFSALCLRLAVRFKRVELNSEKFYWRCFHQMLLTADKIALSDEGDLINSADIF